MRLRSSPIDEVARKGPLENKGKQRREGDYKSAGGVEVRVERGSGRGMGMGRREEKVPRSKEECMHESMR